MLVLVALGLTHMCLLWPGDILTLYGVMDLFLPALMRLRPDARMALMVALFTVPLATHVVVVSSNGRLDPRAPFAAAGAEVREYLGVAGRPALDAFAHGTARDYLAWNTSFAVARPGMYLQSGRPAKVLGLFLLGVWLGRVVLPRVHTLRRSLYMTVAVGGTIGLASSAVDAGMVVEREGFETIRARIELTAAGGPPIEVRLPLALALQEGVTVIGRTVGDLGLAGLASTASRLNLRPIDIPASVDILDSAVMDARGYQKVSDAVGRMAGVVSGEHPTAPSSFSMRGFTASQVATLRDGIWLGPSTMVMRPQNTFNLDRIELMRGPRPWSMARGRLPAPSMP